MSRTIRRPLRRATAYALPLVLLGAGLSLVTVGASVPAAAAGPSSACDAGAVYLVQTDGQVDRVKPRTGELAGTPVVARGSDAEAPLAAAAGGAAGGAVDPRSGTFYAGAFQGSTLVLSRYDPTTHESVGVAARVRVPGAPGHHGDLAFDAAGRLYLAASSDDRAALYVTAVALPAPGSSAKAVSAEATKVRTSKVAGAVTGLAFASDGSLYVSTEHTVARLNPSTGELGAAKDLDTDVQAAGLGSCAVVHVPAPQPDVPPEVTPKPVHPVDPKPVHPVDPKATSSVTTRTSVAAPAPAPALSVGVTSAPVTVARAGQSITYTVTVRNTGNQTLRDAVASAVAPDLPALTCAPVAQGGTLAVGVSTVCTAKRTSTQADLRKGGLTVSASAGAIGPTGTGVVATSATNAGVSGASPKATDDGVDVRFGTPSVVLPASTNDSPGEPGGPELDVSRTVFPLGGSGSTQVSKIFDGRYGLFQALPDGSVRYVLETRYSAPPSSGWTETVRYRTFDVSGRSADASLRVTYHRGATAQPDAVTGLQGDRSVASPLRNDSPGEDVDGVRATFDQASLRFSTDQPVGNAIVSSAGDSLSILYTGTFTASGGTVVFDPDQLWTGSVDVKYQVRDSLGNTASATVTFTVTPVVPKPVDDAVGTPYDTPVTLAGATNDAPGVTGRAVAFAGFVGRDGFGTGARLVTPQGTWSCPVGGTQPTRVDFAPAPGFVGAATASYTVQTAPRGSAVGHLTATVRPPAVTTTGPATPGATAVEDVLIRPQVAYSFPVDPLANDRPGLNGDGTLGTLDVTTVRFPTAGQPSGAQVVDDGRGLLLPRYGPSPWQLTADPATGLITVYPPPGIRGTLPTVRYTVQSRTTGSTGVVALQTVGATLQVRIVGSNPVATDDSATVAAGRGASLPGPSNDIPASRDDPIDIYSGTFPVDQVADLPKGSTVDFHGEFSQSWWEATVPGEGYWRIYWSDPHAVFSPERGFTGTTTPLRYEITDAVGNHADGLLTVTVLPPSGVHRDDVGSTTQGVAVGVDVLANDTPPRLPDGTPAPPPVLAYFPTDSPQPKGSSVSSDGALLVPGEGTYVIELQTARVTFTPLPTFSGTTSPVTVRVGDEQRTDQNSTLRVKVATVTPVATPDAATTKAGVPLRIPVLADDKPGTSSRPLVPSSVRFRSTTGLPLGSSLSQDLRVRVVAGRGVLAAAGDGTLTYYPLPGVVGTLPPLRYDVADVNGTRTASTVTVTATR